MTSLRELFKKVEAESAKLKPAVSITKLPIGKFYKISKMEKMATKYGERVKVTLPENESDVWLTAFWSERLDAEELKAASKEAASIAYLGMKRIGAYSRADLEIRMDAPEDQPDYPTECEEDFAFPPLPGSALPENLFEEKISDGPVAGPSNAVDEADVVLVDTEEPMLSPPKRMKRRATSSNLGPATAPSKRQYKALLADVPPFDHVVYTQKY